jgi:hypothetical protein
MGLGSVIYEQAYNFIKNNLMKPEDMRRHLLGNT